MPISDTPTVAACYANAVISLGSFPAAAASGSGGDPGSPRPDTGTWADPGERLPFSEVRRVWEQVLGPNEPPHTGLRIGNALQPTALHVLGHIVLTCASLAEAAAQAVRYLPLVSEAGSLGLERGGHRSHLSYHPAVPDGAMHPQQVEAVVAAVVTAARWITGSAWAPAAVSFAHPRIGDLAPYTRVLRCPVAFEAGRNAVTVTNTDLDLVRAPADPELAELHRRYAERLLSGLTGPATVRQQVLCWLDRAPLDRLGPEDVQEALNLSQRTLRRLLREEGTSWSALLDATRHDHARRMLATTDLTLERIARALGLSGAPAFVRAFTRWEGTTPGTYRRRHTHDAVVS
ncbi:AraC family transcriptional regulator ligand-binding domain-containing protein [Streptomyces sp. NPDC004647]|uniref:AraC family transcriptional regulator n=1 Tax=Streptomyces sp. NPDC004647 TaxID=3154671 RepID=UPI0033B8B10E